MKKLPEITMNDWMKAEEEMTVLPTQPKGSVTVWQYATARGCCATQARTILRRLYAAGKATRESWKCDKFNRCYVYFLKNGQYK